jgi:hypothetical protein
MRWPCRLRLPARQPQLVPVMCPPRRADKPLSRGFSVCTVAPRDEQLVDLFRGACTSYVAEIVRGNQAAKIPTHRRYSLYRPMKERAVLPLCP